MALFKPNPDAESVEEIVEALSRQLADRFREVEDELIREIAIRAARDMELAQGLGPTLGLTFEERRRQNRILAELNAYRARAARELQAIARSTRYQQQRQPRTPVGTQGGEQLMGDIGKPIKHIELEPLEIPATEPAPVTVPEPEKVPA